jgi:hypothetical protein
MCCHDDAGPESQVESQVLTQVDGAPKVDIYLKEGKTFWNTLKWSLGASCENWRPTTAPADRPTIPTNFQNARPRSAVSDSPIVKHYS